MPVEPALVLGVGAEERVGDLPVHVADRLQHALAEVGGGIAVAQLDGLVLAGRRAGGHGRPSEGAGREPDVDLERRVAARVEELASVHLGDARSRERLLRALVVRVLRVEVEARPVLAVRRAPARRRARRAP